MDQPATFSSAAEVLARRFGAVPASRAPTPERPGAARLAGLTAAISELKGLRSRLATDPELCSRLDGIAGRLERLVAELFRSAPTSSPDEVSSPDPESSADTGCPSEADELFFAWLPRRAEPESQPPGARTT